MFVLFCAVLFGSVLLCKILEDGLSYASILWQINWRYEKAKIYREKQVNIGQDKQKTYTYTYIHTFNKYKNVCVCVLVVYSYLERISIVCLSLVLHTSN